MLSTNTNIEHMTQARFFSANTVKLAHLYHVIHYKQKYTLETFFKKLKNGSNFFDNCLIFHCLFKG